MFVSVATMFDVPWIPIYIAVLFLLHPMIGFVGLAGGVVLVVLAFANQMATRRPLQESGSRTLEHYAAVDAALANSEIVRAHGMMANLDARWSVGREEANRAQILAGDRGALFTGITKSARLLLQVAILAVGGYYVIADAISPGAMIAGMILVGRAIAPVDQLIGNWKQIVTANHAYRRMANLLDEFPARDKGMSLPRPTGRLTVERMTFVPRGVDQPIIKGVGFDVAAGEEDGGASVSATSRGGYAHRVTDRGRRQAVLHHRGRYGRRRAGRGQLRGAGAK